MSTETILILGGSFAGIGAAHYALRHTIPQLPKKQGVTYTVTLVNPSKDFYWRIAGPRAAVSKQLIPPSKYLYPIEPAFAYAKGTFNFVQGSAAHIDTAGHTVSVTTASGQQQSIHYAALIIATGVTTPSPLFTQTNNGSDLESTYNDFQKALSTAKHVVIGGGGPVGVETAGEIAEFLNGKPGFLSSGPKNPRGKVTLICADKKMLPILREAISKTAEKYLNRLGAEVLYNTKVVSATSTEEGKTLVQLADGKTIQADLYVDATGVRPNTSFLPKELLDNRNRVSCNPRTLRVEAAGPLVYVVGDVGSYTRGGVMDMADAIPVAMTNLKTDLVAHISGKPPGPDRYYTANLKEQQIAPIGTAKGVGAFGGWRVPSIMVWFLKGRDYMIGMMALPTVNGDSWKKEGKWKPEVGRAGLSSG
ncbi:FAD/NAD(P)-binding domain-containing protein [Melanomma pulvis-pyrius CBS 109.77]|uniref:FAD/NAD(P)-binding domain-containing protein n=1 Tax=Melanomma pulvis-pyrius CBS 109.77 TaxID=1314802 RepID=A0A6A6XXI5_9PLEO|nr:FAD/NAD(P)-binding domain-containing protein [Melanomma pulvis-pyrius CBS 109.77]